MSRPSVTWRGFSSASPHSGWHGVCMDWALDWWSGPVHRVTTEEQRAVQRFHPLLTFRGRSPHPPRIHPGSSHKQIIPAQELYVGHCPLPLPTLSRYQADPRLLTLRGSYAFPRRSNEMRNPLFPLLSPEHVFLNITQRKKKKFFYSGLWCSIR